MEKVKRNQKIPVSQLDNVKEQLGELNKKKKSELNLRESIYYLRHKLKRALRQGYSYEDLAQILAEQNIVISATTLKQYLSVVSKKPTRKKQLTKFIPEVDSSTPSDLPQNSSKNTSKVKKIKQTDDKKSFSTSKTVATSPDNKHPTAENTNSRLESNKPKSAILSGLDRDLSNEFNQY